MEYGLIGERLGHSYSKEIHKNIADYQYELKEIAREDVGAFLEARDFKGINVTIPYKQTVIPYLDYISDSAKSIGAVNTIVNKDGKLYGYNTDFDGMREELIYAGIELAGKKVLILGTGGTSKTAKAVANSLGAGEIINVSRRADEGVVTYEEAYEKHSDAQIIINTTPVGMFPNVDAKPIDIAAFEKLEGILDVIYNPLATKLVEDGISRGIPAIGGLYMLAGQAVYASALFRDVEVSKDVIQVAYDAVLKQKQNEKKNVVITPSKISGALKAPSSKSYAHRLMICAALSEGTSVVKGVADSEDMLATLDCIKAMGATFDKKGSELTITGRSKNSLDNAIFPCRESGSTLRFMIPSAIAYGGNVTFTGTRRLLERGIGVYEDALSKKDIKVDATPEKIDISGKLIAGTYEIPGNISSQFVSGLLMALPLLSEDSVVKVLPPVESRAYIDITIDAMGYFGVQIEEPEPNTFVVKGNQKYQPKEIEVEGDWSNAAALFGFNSIGGKLEVSNLRYDSTQGDKVCLDYLKQLDEKDACFDISNCPDLGPVLFAVAAAKNGATITGIKRLRIKESDRVAAMAQELEKFGVKCDIEENSIKIYGGNLQIPSEATDSHNDHRIVMAMSLLLSITGGKIKDAGAIKKSYPNYFEDMKSVGLEAVYEA